MIDNDDIVISRKTDNAKTHAFIAYCLMIVGLFTGFFWLVGAMWAMGKKSAARDTIFEDHYDNIISTFWWGLGLSIIGFVLAIFFIGYILLFAIWIWSIYRIITGLAKLTSNESFKSQRHRY